MNIISGSLYYTVRILLLVPIGVVIGALAERLSTRSIGITPNKVWNITVKMAVAMVLWTRFINLHSQSNDANVNQNCVLPSAIPLLYYSKNNNLEDELYEKCTVTQGVEIILSMILKCTLLCLSIHLGSSFQPVGLTGGIACGKSTVSKLLRATSETNDRDAFAIIDVDAIAHDILIPGKMKAGDSAYDKVVSTFKDDDILEKSDQGTKNESELKSPLPIDRRKLGDIIFCDHAKRRKLNAITHPLISKVMMKQIIREYFTPTSNDASIVAVDIPLLFEVGLKMKLLFAIKVVVACTSEIQLERLMNRNPDLTREQCQNRIDSQMPLYKKVEMADIIIWNNGTMDDLIRETEDARKEIVSRKHGFMGITISSILAFACLLTSALCTYDLIRI